MSLFRRIFYKPEGASFKYKITQHEYDQLEDREEMAKIFDNYGFDSWELISMNPVENSNGDRFMIAYWKVDASNDYANFMRELYRLKGKATKATEHYYDNLYLGYGKW